MARQRNQGSLRPLKNAEICQYEGSTARDAVRRQRQGLVEYTLIIALVSVVAIVALRLLGRNANSALNSAATAI